jgi:NitT/TauT family transport system substrate-binding protein
MLASCSHRQEAMQSKADSTGIDTTVLRVAVMPAMNCLPVFYAVRTGLADSLGLEMELLRYQAQMDIDTAIVNGHADIAFTDLIRCAKLGKQGVTITPFASCDEALSLISLKTKRVKQVNQMKEQMIAVSRLSATDYWCDRVLDDTHTSYDDIYRPQVNDVWLRAEMLRQGLIDAAIMGEPFATWMTMLGHKRLFQSSGKQPQLYAWAATTSATKQQQKTFRKLLDEAILRLGRASEAQLLRDILKQEYALPVEMVDSMALQPLKPVSNIRQSDVEEAETWLKRRCDIKKIR